MADPILLEVLTPERKVLATRASDVQFPTLHRGTYGILPDHTPVMTPLGDGLLTYTREAKPHRLAIFGGFAEVGPDHVTILAREADTLDIVSELLVRNVSRKGYTLGVAKERLRVD